MRTCLARLEMPVGPYIQAHLTPLLYVYLQVCLARLDAAARRRTC